MNHTKRLISCILALCAALSCFSFAYADDLISVSAQNRVFTENSGSLAMTVEITNGNDYPIKLAAVQPNGGAIISASASDATPASDSGVIEIPKNSTKAINVSAALAGSGNDAGSLSFLFNYQSGEETKVAVSECSDFSIIRTPAATEEPKEEEKEDTEFSIRTSSVDAAGFCVPTPSGDYGDEITLRLPLVCTNGCVNDLKVTPVLSTDVEKFPFDITLVDYTLSSPQHMCKGDIVEFMYPMRLSKKATVGVKQVDFTVTYRNNKGDLKSGTVSLFVNVRKGLTATSEDATASVPRLIIEGYSLSSDKIYAGEVFDLDFTVRNTSSSESIQNVQIRVKDADTTATVIPASGGSNSLYISKISKGESSKQKISLQTAPDAEAKSYTLNVEFTYESASTNASHTANETISVPILQKIRLKCDDPVIYDDMGWVDSSCSMYVRMYNMGRSSIYNCMVDVEGNGLKMEESYFGGTLAPGATLSADFSVIPSVAGNIEGAVIISYEDVYGEAGQERLPFTLYVEDPAAMMPDPMEEQMMAEPEPEPKGIPWWGWAIGAGALGGGSVVGIKALRKRRARSLEDDI